MAVCNHRIHYDIPIAGLPEIGHCTGTSDSYCVIISNAMFSLVIFTVRVRLSKNIASAITSVLDHLDHEQPESLKSEQVQYGVHSTVHHYADRNYKASQIKTWLFKLKYIVLKFTIPVHMSHDKISNKR